MHRRFLRDSIARGAERCLRYQMEKLLREGLLKVRQELCREIYGKLLDSA